MKLNFQFCRVAPSQPRLELVLPQDDLLSPTSHPPKPGLGYLCPSPGQVPKKKFLSPGRRSTALTGRQAGPGWWQAPFFILLVSLLCIRIRAFKCVNVSAAWQPRFRLFWSFFGAKIRHVSEHRPYCGLSFGHKKCAKKICAPERTVDQKRADNPGLERAGVRLFFVVKSELFFRLSILFWILGCR